jgi:serine/alanine adding enzyme
MQVQTQRGGHPPGLRDKIGQERLDLYHEPDTLDLIYDDWWSVLITEGDQAFASCFGRRPIGGTGLFDIEPVMGYAGLLTNTVDPSFLARALEAYSAACRDLGVVAELIRFNPLLEDQLPFSGQPSVTVLGAKEVVACRCSENPDAILAGFSASRRKLVTRMAGRLTSRLLDKAHEIHLFRALYDAAMVRLETDAGWRFGDGFYDGVAANPRYAFVSVWKDDRLLAACLIGCRPPIAHYVIAANTADYVEGAGERLIFEAALEAARRGCDQLILGGGVTGAADDGLLVFKERFAPDTRTFHIGKMVHDEARYRALCEAAIAAKPSLNTSRQLLLYRDL